MHVRDSSIEEIRISVITTGDLLRFRNLPANHQITALITIRHVRARARRPEWLSFGLCDATVATMDFASGLILSFTAILLVYIYGKLNDAKLGKVPPEVRALATSNFSPENIRLTAARLKESPLQIRSRLPPRTGRRYIVVGGVGGRSLPQRNVTKFSR